MQCETRRLQIGALGAADAEALFAYRSDPHVARYQGWWPASLAETQVWIARNAAVPDAQPGWRQRAIRQRDNGVLIGDLGLRLPAEGDPEAEIGISIIPAQQGNGFAREALTAALDWLFTVHDVHRVCASVDPRNMSSLALLRRLGMRQEAHFRERFLLRDEWVDDVVFGLLKQEWSMRDPRDAP